MLNIDPDSDHDPDPDSYRDYRDYRDNVDFPPALVARTQNPASHPYPKRPLALLRRTFFKIEMRITSNQNPESRIQHPVSHQILPHCLLHRLHFIMDLELAIDVFNVFSNGAVADKQILTNFFVAETCLELRKDFQFACR